MPSSHDIDNAEHHETSNARRILIVAEDGSVIASLPISASSLPLPANAAKEASGNLATLAAKDFATQTTLALIKAKTDNLDLAITALRDALRGAGSKTLSDIVTALGSVAVTGTFWQTTQPVSQKALPLATNVCSTKTLTSANTAYQIASIPSSAYLLVLCNASDTDIYWGFATLTSGGILLAKTGGTVAILCAASVSPYFYCASAGKVLNFTTTVI